MSTPVYHIPVMLDQCIEGLAILPNGVYVDVTFGGGGHAKEILARLEGGHLFGFDQDSDALANAPQDPRFTFVQANFRDIKRYLRLHGIKQVDGILADLGISSHQIDAPERGFSTRFEGNLDMRMNQSAEFSAKELLASADEGKLHKILGMYGEIKNAKTLAQSIVAERSVKPFTTTEGFTAFLKRFAPRGKEFKYYAQVFQALRIEVNDEMGALEEMLLSAVELLKPEGRLVVMSYHSLEDRLVKSLMTKGKFQGEVEKDFYGNLLRPLEPVSRGAITASEEELARNSRSRSAKLRVAKKNRKMSQNTFKNKLKEGSSPKGRSGKTIFSWIEEKFDVKRILGEGVPVQLVPPVGFVALLALIYIYSNLRAENKIREIDKAKQEVADIRADVTTLEADYMKSSMQSEVSKRVAVLELYELNEPPVKIELPKK